MICKCGKEMVRNGTTVNRGTGVMQRWKCNGAKDDRGCGRTALSPLYGANAQSKI